MAERYNTVGTHELYGYDPAGPPHFCDLKEPERKLSTRVGKAFP